MALRTSNLYGKIVVSNRALRTVVIATAAESVGVHSAKGAEVVTMGSRMYIDLNIILKFGVSVEAVIESVRSAVKYNVENFSGMIVEYININVVGIKK